MSTCNNCKCIKCGRIHQCEAILDMLEYLDTLENVECSSIKACKSFTPHRNTELNKNWDCPINKT